MRSAELLIRISVQFSSVAQACPTLCNPMDCSTPVFPVHHQLLEPTQTHVYLIGRCHPTISSSIVPFSSCLQFFRSLGTIKRKSLIADSTEVKVAQVCPTLCDPLDYTVHGILQARILEWVAFPFSRGSSQPGN